MMADIAKVKRNIQRMIDQNAPESDIDAYVASEGTTPEELRATKTSQPMSYGDTAMDMLKSAGSGVVSGVQGIAGAIGDTQQMAGDALSWAGRQMGAGEDTQKMLANAGRYTMPLALGQQMPRTGQIDTAREAITGPLHQPQTTAGKYARTVGEFAPSAVAGPGGMVRKAAMAVIPGMASEGAGQATEGTAAEPYARVGGALAGGVAAAGRGSAPVRQMMKEAPNAEAVAAMTKDAYGALDKAKIVFDPKSYKSTAMKIQMDLRKHGLLAEDSGDIASTLKDIVSRVKKVNGWNEVDSLRKRLGKIASSSNPDNATDAARASIIVKHLDELVDSGNVISLKGIPRDKIPEMVDNARELGRRNILGRQIAEMDRKSEHYVSGAESGQRNQFANYLRSSKGKGLTEAERNAFKKVTTREGILNVLTTTGGRLNQAVGPSVGAGAGFMAGGPLGAGIGAVASYGAHLGARKLMEKLTDKRVRDAMATALAGKKAQSKAVSASKTLKNEALVRALLATESGLRTSSPANGR